METAAEDRLEGLELQGIYATFCSYESLFGPNHPQTLRMICLLGMALLRHGELDQARIVLERGVRDLGRVLGREHDWRLDLLNALRDLLVRQDDQHRAGVVQQELVNCLAERFGPEHSDTVMERDRLTQMLLAGV